MEQVSIALKVFFVAITLLTVWQFYRAANTSKPFLVAMLIWMICQLIIGQTDFYTNEFTKPPRFLLLVLPPLIVIIALFITKPGRAFIDSLDNKKLTLLHTVRALVEIALYYLFVARAVPQIMTFEGRNFDILAGITAPLIYYFGYRKPTLSNNILILWNVLCLGLLINILIIALLSAKTPFQQFAFDQPNIAIAYFPFNWLPSVIVPLVLFSHLAALKHLIVRKRF